MVNCGGLLVVDACSLSMSARSSIFHGQELSMDPDGIESDSLCWYTAHQYSCSMSRFCVSASRKLRVVSGIGRIVLGEDHLPQSRRRYEYICHTSQKERVDRLNPCVKSIPSRNIGWKFDCLKVVMAYAMTERLHHVNNLSNS